MEKVNNAEIRLAAIQETLPQGKGSWVKAHCVELPLYNLNELWKMMIR